MTAQHSITTADIPSHQRDEAWDVIPRVRRGVHIDFGFRIYEPVLAVIGRVRRRTGRREACFLGANRIGVLDLDHRLNLCATINR